MFERFTDAGRQVLARANEVADELKSPYVRRHHMLIALLDNADGEELVAEVLDAAAVDRSSLRAALVASATASEEAVDAKGTRPFSSGARTAIELALREALSLGHNYIASFHLLLSILRTADGPLEEVLAPTGLDYDKARGLVRTNAPDGRRRRSDLRRRVRTAMRLGNGTPGLELVLKRAYSRTGAERNATTGDLLVALADTRGTHFASILASASLPDVATIIAEADRLIVEGTQDGEPDPAIRFDKVKGSATIDDPGMVEALRRVAESSGGVDKLREALRNLQSEDDPED